MRLLLFRVLNLYLSGIWDSSAGHASPISGEVEILYEWNTFRNPISYNSNKLAIVHRCLESGGFQMHGV